MLACAPRLTVGCVLYTHSMSIDQDVPFITTQTGSNDPDVVKTKGERSGRCQICGDKDKIQRTFTKTVTPFAINANTAPTKRTRGPSRPKR